MEEKMEIKGKYQENRNFDISWIRLFLLPAGMFLVWVLLSGASGFFSAVTHASPSAPPFKEEVKIAIKKLSASLMESVSKNDIDAIQAMLNQIILDAEKEGNPIRFGIGILDRNGVAVTGRYIVGTFRKEDFSKYKFVKKAFKKRKIVQNRLYFQDYSELLILCAPLVQQKTVVGALILGFNPTEVKKDYGLNTEQFLAIDFNK